MADIQPIKPIKLCINITIPTIDDDSISLYECVGILGNKLQEAIQKINESLGSLEDVYRPENPPPYPVTSVNRAETKDVITVFEPEGGDIEDVSQAELIAAYKAGARLGAFNQDNGTCRLYHFNLYIDPERVDYKEVAGGGASGVTSVNGRTGAVNIFNAPISAATAKSVSELSTTTQKQINQLKSDIEPLLYNNAGTHNAIYRGKNLGASVTDAQLASIKAGTFEDLYIGDYWTIGGVTYRIAAFDYYLRAGDTDMTTHHVTLVPDASMYSHMMNDTNVTTGGYVGSKMYTTGLADAKTTINNVFGSTHILTHRRCLCNAVSNGKPSGVSWYDSTVELMTELNVYGSKVFGVCNTGSAVPILYTVDKSQYPLFAFRPDLISNRVSFWLRDVSSSSTFAYISNNGRAAYLNASETGGVRPAFSVIG
mgnify:CR=1 FL=1